jgi:hypothetical protein
MTQQVFAGGAYLIKARVRFLEGTRFKTPEECVQAGVRSIREWSDILSEERQMARIPDRPAGSDHENKAGSFL